LRVRVEYDIDRIDPAEWDSLLDKDDLQATHRFVKVCQHSGVASARYRHVMLYDSRGILGLASFSSMPVALDCLSSGTARAVIEKARRWHPSLLRVPVVFCGLPVSFGQSCLRLHPRADRAECLRLLAQAGESFAEEVRAPVLCFKELKLGESDALRPLTGLGYFRAASLPSCFLDIAWPSFEAFLASMRSGYRRQVLETMRRGHAGGLRVRVVEGPSADWARLYTLYREVISRAAFKLETLNPAFFSSLREGLGPQSKVVLAERDGHVLAAAILLEGPTVTTFLLAGIDYERGQALCAYPSVVIEVIAEAIRRGAVGLEMGQTSYALKTRLGARPAPRHLYLKCRSASLHGALRSARSLLFPAFAPPARRVFLGGARPAPCSGQEHLPVELGQEGADIAGVLAEVPGERP
jgi:predicted N-acyltransferase